VLATVEATSPARPEDDAGASARVEKQPPENALSPGDKAGDFVVDGVLGHGSYGSVYSAAHHVIGRRAAVKVLRRSAAEARAIAAFIEEARLVSRLRHPNIVDVLTFGQLEDGRHFQVMDLIEGPTLADFLEERGALDLREALPIVRGIASALDAVHKSGVAHRDLKPANVVLERRDGEPFPKLIDFGVAELITTETDQASAATAGALIGTPRYMAPEQCRGKKVDARADSYAFGLLLYEMLTGKPPFAGDDALELMLKHTDEQPVPPSRVAPSLPAAVDPIILSLLEKQPEERPLELVPVVRELEAIASGPSDDKAPPTRSWRVPALVGGLGLAGAIVFAVTRDPAPASGERAPTSNATTAPQPAAAPLPDRPEPKEAADAVSPAIAASASAAPSASPPGARPVRRGPAPSAVAPGPEDPENPFGR